MIEVLKSEISILEFNLCFKFLKASRIRDEKIRIPQIIYIRIRYISF